MTSPLTHAKSQPLYLQPNAKGDSVSYFESSAQLRGRKLYWKQNPDGEDRTGVWELHAYDEDAHKKVALQCRPPMECLQGIDFTCRLEFENLSEVELGCLLFALTGGGEPSYTIALGMGKPRGLGACRLVDIQVETEDPRARYKSTSEVGEKREAGKNEVSTWLGAFKTWCEANQNDGTTFEMLPHVRDFLSLHKWPKGKSVRYYPLNFDQYNPPIQAPSGPTTRVKAMRRARDID